MPIRDWSGVTAGVLHDSHPVESRNLRPAELIAARGGPGRVSPRLTRLLDGLGDRCTGAVESRGVGEDLARVAAAGVGDLDQFGRLP